MSRLPRLHSSPVQYDNYVSMAAAAHNLKRKAAGDQELENFDLEATDQPRKLPAIGASSARQPVQPLRASSNAHNIHASQKPSIQPLTKPRAPVLSSSNSRTRSTSAPPKGSAAGVRSVSDPSNNPRREITRRVPSTSNSTSTNGRNIGTSSRTLASNGVADRRFQDLHNKFSSMESAQAADAARLAADMDSERTKVAELQANHLALSKELVTTKSQEIAQRRELASTSDELHALRKKHALEILDLEMDVKRKGRETQQLEEDLRITKQDLERERTMVTQLKSTLSQQATAQLTLSTQNQVLHSQNGSLQAMLNTNGASAATLRLQLEAAEQRIEELEVEAREAEGIRRKLHNMVQELKGNIRVFCRVRPVLPSDLEKTTEYRGNLSAEEAEKLSASLQADIIFPDRKDHREIVLSSISESATGQERKELYNFGFDRVFEPSSTQAEVFEEISLLAQSCVDGYNVCIFAYGQTGSGKSFTMEGGMIDSTSGMIPRAVEQVFRVSEELKSKGWEYTMEGQFLEIYNETINDLLGKGEFDKKKHEIKHDPKTGLTSVTDTITLPLGSPAQVRTLLGLAQSRRTVAATLMNERSSRSHSVFTLRILGTNKQSGESSSGSLNLVDLAGSERINASGVANEKERLKETVNINRSLSALGDVIAALGEKSEKGDKHIPYRNSKLTYLLQNSLSGNSKTLMVLNLSPLAAHLNESLTSLRFATKVNNTTLGTAKKQIRA